jgi:hypothetical protein
MDEAPINLPPSLYIPSEKHNGINVFSNEYSSIKRLGSRP